MTTPRVLLIGAIDHGGAGGLIADVKTATALGAFAATVTTAIVVRDGPEVVNASVLSPGFVRQQLDRAMALIDPQVIKIGFLGTAGQIDTVAEVLEPMRDRGLTLVIDPSCELPGMVLDEEARAALKRRLIVLADVLTPSTREATALSGMEVRDTDDIDHLGMILRTLGPETVLLAGVAQGDGQTADLLFHENGEERLMAPSAAMAPTPALRDTLATAIAVERAKGTPVMAAVRAARGFVQAAERDAHEGTDGTRWLNHAHPVPAL